MDRREFLVGAAASVLLLSRGREKGLLTEGIQAPDFMTDGLSLRQYRGRSRVILVFDPPGGYLEDVAAHRTQYAQRDLVVLAFVPADAPRLQETPGLVHLLRDADAVTTLYRAGGGGPVFYLIGKDGHVALARHGIPHDEELFALIDAMPMRRREMRERGERQP